MWRITLVRPVEEVVSLMAMALAVQGVLQISGPIDQTRGTCTFELLVSDDESLTGALCVLSRKGWKP